MQQEEIKNIAETVLRDFFDLKKIGEQDLDKIVSLKEAYPYCQAFYLFAAQAALGTSSYERHLEEAAVVAPSRSILYDVIYRPERLGEVISGPDDQEWEDKVYDEITPHLEPELADSGTYLQPDPVGGDDTEFMTISLEPIEEPDIKPVQEVPYIETLGDEFLNEVNITEGPFTEEIKDETTLPALKQKAEMFRYHEDRLPYTFLWWLNKTRKQYENIRPYADYYLDNAVQDKEEKDELEHQIVEHIFHQTSLDEVDSNKQTIPFDFMKKQHRIIERFIQEEPHITAPRADKIDTENKARRSSEDDNELVSETLARVYVEQMLYHKALDIYRKLSLKYPEKNAYFASQIKYLELKVN